MATWVTVIDLVLAAYFPGAYAKMGIFVKLIVAFAIITMRPRARHGLWLSKAPIKKQEYPCTINLRGGAVSTSGNYEMYYDREKYFIISSTPRAVTRRFRQPVSPSRRPTAMDTDILSTAVFVMEPSEGRTIQSSGWPV